VADNQVSLEVMVEIKDALGRLDEFEKKASKSTNSVEKSFGAMKAAAAAAVAVFAGKQVVDFFAAGIDAAVAQENAMRQLQTALEQTGESSDKAMKQFGDFANEMEATTKFADDVVIQQVAIAKSFGVTNEQAETLVKTAADLASATGQDLPAAVQQLGKTYGGATGKLDEMLPALRGLTKEQLANGEAVRLLAERYGGAAEAEIQTFSGALLQTKNAVGNFQEAIGAVIVENPAVVAAIKGMRDVFSKLEEIVVANRDTIGTWVTNGVQFAAFSAQATASALAGLAEAFAATTGAVLDGIAAFADGAAGLLSFVPGAGESALAMANFAEDMHKTADETTASLGSMSQTFNSFEAVVSKAAVNVVQADDKVAVSAKKAAVDRSTLARAAADDAKELEKLADAAAKFETGLRQATGNEAANVQAKLQEQLASIQQFEEKKVVSVQNAEELRVLAVSNSVDKINKLREDETKKAKEELDKQMAEYKAAVEQAGANPIKFGVDQAGISPLGLDQGTSKGIAAAGGAANMVLGGKEGARSLVTGLGAAAADAFIPGLGAVAGPLLDALSQGPEQTKAMVKGFVEGIPDIITAIAESAPVLVEALVDSLINEGGLVKIAVALGKAMLGIEIGKSIAKQLGVNLNNIIPSIGRSFANAFRISVPWSTIGSQIGEPIKTSLQFGGVVSAGEIKESFTASIESFRALMKGDFQGAFQKAFEAIKVLLPDILKAPAEKLQEQINKLFNFKFPTIELPAWLQNMTDALKGFTETPAWLDRFNAIIEQLTGAFDSSGHGAVPFANKPTASNPLGFATGGTVPGGFPDDTFPARLTSGELVVPRGDVDRLSSFLDRAERGDESLGGAGPVLLRIAAALEGRQQPIELKLDGAVVAKAVYSANYRNARLAR
jgi:hypothetical protein